MKLAENLPVDLARLLETRLLVQGASGSGKTVAVKRLLEQTHGKVQHLVLDVEDEYAPLRERFDYVLAGAGRDCPADARCAALLARKLLELGQSAIVNLHELKVPERARVVKLFLESLMSAPKSLWRDVLVVIEEAELWCPQSGRESEATSAVIDLAARGRKRGFALVAVTQRISDLQKSVVAQAGNRLIGKTTLDADMKRAAYELGFAGRAEAIELSRLGRGEFFAHGPALSDRVVRAQILPIKTSHGVARGARASAPPPPRDAVKRILAELADLPAEAEAELRDVTALRARVAELERAARATEARLAAAPAPPSSAALDAARREARTADSLAKRLRKALEAAMQLIVKITADDFLNAAGEVDREAIQKTFDQAAAAIVRAVEQKLEGRNREVDALRRDARRVLDGLKRALEADLTVDLVVQRTEQVRVTPAPSAKPAPVPAGESSGVLPTTEQKILDECVALESIGISPVDKVQLALMCGYSNARSGGFSEPVARLRSEGLIESSAGAVRVTDAGRSVARAVPPPATSEELQQRMLAKLDRPRARMLEALIEIYPESISKESLGQRLGYGNVRSGGFSEPIASLKALGLIEADRGQVRATEILFLYRPA